MPEPIQSLRTRVHGRWSPRHELFEGEKPLGVLAVRRRRSGVVSGAEYRPQTGEAYLFRRDHGLLRSQFSMWTDGREWLGSSLRWSFVRRAVQISTGTMTYKLHPLPGFRRGWMLYAPATGEVAEIRVGLVGRTAEIDVYRRLEFPHVLFAYFLGSLIYTESFWPGPSPAKAAAG